MIINYANALDVRELVIQLTQNSELSYISPEMVYCIRSYGSKSKRIIARIHGLGRIWQKARAERGK